MRAMVKMLGLTALLAATPAWSWGPQGHHVTGAIADRLLTPEARAAVEDLLRGDLDKDGRPSGRTTLEAVAVWADEIRGTPADRSSWHYDNRSVCSTPDPARYCAEGVCNTSQTERLVRVLANPNAPRRERNEALKWIVHLVGDIHQPLHSADNADRGGNSVNVALQGVRTRGNRNLHGVWDTDLVRLALALDASTRTPPEIDSLSRQARALAARQGQGAPDGWGVESNALARASVYRYPAFACGASPTSIVVLGEDYQIAATKIVRERVLLGGARLAGLLNSVFAAARQR